MNGHDLRAKLDAMSSDQLDCELFATFGNDENGNAIPIIVTDLVLSNDLSVNGLLDEVGNDNMPIITLSDENGELDLVRGESTPQHWRGRIEPEGVYLDETRFAQWPDTDGRQTIRVQDEHGDTVEIVNRDTDDPVERVRWNELRDLMPDDALYFQPDGAGDDGEEPSVAQLPSYAVYRDYDAASKAHPNAEILGFQFADIEEPFFKDVQEPKLYWNEGDEDE